MTQNKKQPIDSAHSDMLSEVIEKHAETDEAMGKLDAVLKALTEE